MICTVSLPAEAPAVLIDRRLRPRLFLRSRLRFRPFHPLRLHRIITIATILRDLRDAQVDLAAASGKRQR